MENIIYTTNLSSSGQITLPKPVRAALDIQPGAKVTIKLAGGTATVERAQSLEDMLKDFDAAKTPAIKSAIKQNAGKSAADLREEWSDTKDGKDYYHNKYGVDYQPHPSRQSDY